MICELKNVIINTDKILYIDLSPQARKGNGGNAVVILEGGESLFLRSEEELQQLMDVWKALPAFAEA